MKIRSAIRYIVSSIRYVVSYKRIKRAKEASKRFLSYCDFHVEYRNNHEKVYDYVKKSGLTMYPYQWFGEIKDKKYKIEKMGGLKYTVYKGKRLYYSSSVSDKDINASINFYEKEQDQRSPHCYIPSLKQELREGDVLVECGASEGTFALTHIDKCSKVYLFEGDPRFIQGLEKTFEPYKDKVTIVNKYVDSYAHADYVTIDDIVKEPVNFIKMDIEGYELKALFGARKTIERSDALKMSICAYHNAEDYAVIPAYLKSLGCIIDLSEGYLFRSDKTLFDSEVPDLRHGMIFARKGKAETQQ